MELYFRATHLPMDEWPLVAASNLEGMASLWLQTASAAIDWQTLNWDVFITKLQRAMLPKDIAQCNLDALFDFK